METELDNRCPYCEGAEAIITAETTDDRGIAIQYPNKLIAYGYNVHGSGSNGLVAYINFCPICGRKLPHQN